MKKALLAVALVASVGVGYAAHAQSLQRSYRNGSVWSLQLVRVEPGMDAAYLNYLAADWKKVQEALKKEGLILSYKVLTTEGHGGDDWNLLLMTEVKDLATLEANERKAEAIMVNLQGGDAKAEQGMHDRLKLRRLLGERMAREIVLAPAPGA